MSDKLELGYNQLNKMVSNDTAIMYVLTSLAISAKRIADVLEKGAINVYTKQV